MYDPLLRRLVSENSVFGVLLQAFLHFATTSFYPDPLTQLTGVEHAVLLLQQECIHQVDTFSKIEEYILAQF